MPHPIYRQDSLWQKASLANQMQIPLRLRAWLLDNGSLTRRLQHIAEAEFKVKILFQGWALPMLNEARRLKISYKHRVFSREVLLYCDGKAMVFARTVIPKRALKGPLSRLANLGEKPLGEILFSDPRIHRKDLELSRLRPGQSLYELATSAVALPRHSAAVIWARRSTFVYHQKQLLVSEIFLPNEEFGYC